MQKAKVNHPYIEANEKICGGSPVVKGTRTRVVENVRYMWETAESALT